MISGVGEYLSISPSALNDRDEVVIGIYTPEFQARSFVWTPDGGVIDLGSLGGSWTQPADINAEGEVVGLSETEQGQLHAFRWTRSDGMIDLGPENGVSAAASINARGLITGNVEEDGRRYPALWLNDRKIRELPVLHRPHPIRTCQYRRSTSLARLPAHCRGPTEHPT